MSADGTTVFVGSDDGNLYAVHAANGTRKWIFTAGQTLESTPRGSADGTTNYVGADNGNLYALEAETGVKRWSFKAGGEVRARPVESSDGAIIFVGAHIDDIGKFYAVYASGNLTTDSKMVAGNAVFL